jgi:hypothetical protein
MAASRNDPPIETFSVLAQLVEQLTVNQRVAGSSPADGAIFPQFNQRVSEPLGPLARSFLGDW